MALVLFAVADMFAMNLFKNLWFGLVLKQILGSSLYWRGLGKTANA